MIEFDIEILKQFDGNYNYFNPSGNNLYTLFRREFNYKNLVLLSDIIDQNDNIILQHYFDDDFCYSYEDARFIGLNEISVSCCVRPLNNLSSIKEVQFKKYNLLTKKFVKFTNLKNSIEKNWQFIGGEDKIIYHICPYTIINHKEEITYLKNINFEFWIKDYGYPRLSTNIFSIESKKYLLFHSNVSHSDYLKYFIGLLRVDDNYVPIDYLKFPLLESSIAYSCPSILFNLWNWRNTQLSKSTKYEIIFPMNVLIDERNINIYSGINDCSAGIIKINKFEFLDKIKL
jgi:hypothetical protein